MDGWMGGWVEERKEERKEHINVGSCGTFGQI